MVVSELPLAVNLVLFVAAASGVWVAGTSLAGYADEIADRRKLGKAFVGLVFLATVTELPEIATTFTASISGNAPLVLNNMFGGIAMQTAVLAVTDGLLIRGALTSYPRKPTHALEAAFLVFMLALLLGLCIVGDRSIGFDVGIGTVILLGAYVLTVRFLRTYDKRRDWTPAEIRRDTFRKRRAVRKYADLTMRTLAVRSVVASLAILVCGVTLVRTSESLALQTGLGSSFIGVTVLAAATSLPELSTTIAAARLGAFSMAISNIFGSNLIMLALLLPADILYREGPILNAAGQPEFLALIAGILVTAVYIVGLLTRQKPKVFGMGADSALVLALYIGSIVILYFNR